MTETSEREFDFLEKAGFVLLVLQLALFAKLWSDWGFDRATDGFPVFMTATALFVAAQRKLAARPPNAGAGRWMRASRAVLLTMLVLGTLVIGYYRLVPDAAPPPTLVPQTLFGLLWAAIALKGAGIGKLRPNRLVGLRVSWTIQSRLAWDRAHRALGRVLFWGGLAGLATSLVIPPLASIALWLGTVALAVVSGLYEGWRAWRFDPDRARPAG